MAPSDSSPPAADALLQAFRSLLNALLSEPQARRHLRKFAQDIAAALGEEVAPTDGSQSDTTLLEIPLVWPDHEPAVVPREVPGDVIPSREAVKQLKWAQTSDSRLTDTERSAAAARVDTSASDVSLRPVTWRSVADEELALIPQRCRLKAEACRWKLERKRLMEAGRRFADDIEPRDKDLIARAKQIPNCFLWMNWQEGPLIGATTAWDALADCFDTLAEAVQLLAECMTGTGTDEFPDLVKEALTLAAEAQSAVRSGAREVGYEDDLDQDRTYNWLKRTAAERGHYIVRYMRVDDPADPTNSADVRRRLLEFRERFEARRGQDKVRKKRMGQLKYLSNQIQQDLDADQSYNWDKLIAAVDELVQSGEPPSSKEIRRYLLPILDELPAGDLPDNVALVLREIDRFLGDNPGEEPQSRAAERHSPQVLEVARRLAGRTMVLIGGVRKPGHIRALQEAFQLKEVVWVATREHQSVTKFEPFVRQPEVAVVVLAIRWTSHSYGEVKDYCDQYGKPFVRLKAGYNPTQVAAHILDQVSDRLPLSAVQSESA